jgi:hypothetical protein
MRSTRYQEISTLTTGVLKACLAFQLVTELIQLAERRHEETKNRTTSFSTNYLKQF